MSKRFEVRIIDNENPGEDVNLKYDNFRVLRSHEYKDPHIIGFAMEFFDNKQPDTLPLALEHLSQALEEHKPKEKEKEKKYGPPNRKFLRELMFGDKD